ATMVYVTHDQIEAMTLADRIVVMNQGRIEQIGKPLDLYYTPANLFVAGFIGSPAMNFFPATVERVEAGEARVKGVSIAPLTLPAGSLTRGAQLTIGVRPEHLTSGAPGAFGATGLVELVERLGEASYAHVRRADDKMMVVEIRGRDTPSPGQTVTFAASTEDLHVFDEAGWRAWRASAEWRRLSRLKKTDNYLLTAVPGCSIFVPTCRRPEGEGRVSDSVEAVPPGAACNRAVGGGRAIFELPNASRRALDAFWKLPGARRDANMAFRRGVIGNA